MMKGRPIHSRGMRFPKNPVLQMMWDFMHNFEVLGGRFEWNGKRARLTVSPGAGSSSSGYPRAFELSVSQGSLPSTEGTVTIAAGNIEWHGPDGSLYVAVASHTTGSGGFAALSNGINILYATFDWSGTPTGDIGIATGASESVALNAIDSGATDTVKPLGMVTYNSTTKQVAVNTIYFDGNWEPGSLYSYDAP